MILNEPYNKDSLNSFLKDFLPDYQLDERSVRTPDKSILTEVTQLGASRKAEVTVLEAECEETDTNRRIAITQAAFKVLRDHGIRNAIIAFHDGADHWRLSLLTSTLEIKDGKVIKKDSNPRRYSYLLGVGAKTVTPYKYLVEKGRVEDIKQLQERFSVEVVNKQFYASVADLFTKLVGGERGATKYPGLLKINSIISQDVEHQEFAVRLIGRIIFSWFLKEKKSTAGVPIVPNELLSLDAAVNNADYYHSILEPLFFELLNKRVENRHESLREAPFSTVPYLNGGLFSPQRGDFYSQNSFNGAGTPGLTHIPDGWFTELFTVLEQYNFTVDENTSYDVDLSIDPEMLGRIFENLLAEINPETGESARKSTGSFYTPREIVDYMVDSSLLEFLKTKTGADEAKLKALISWGQADDDEHPLSDSEKQMVVNALAGLTILDPACGSGAFPIGILQKVVYILQQADPRAEIWLENQLKNIASPELKRDIQEKYESENYDWLRKYGVIRETIFGIDIQTIATEISKLRCFLTLIIEETVDDEKPNRGVHALPNLDFKFVTANSLIGLPESNVSNKGKVLNLFEDVSHIEQLKSIRNQYFGANADERARLQVEFKNLQMDMLRSRIASSNSTSDLYNELSDWDPFSHKATNWFDTEWMFGVEGFDIVIANPPYFVYQGHNKDEIPIIKKIPLYDKAQGGKLNAYKLFLALSPSLLKSGGITSYIFQNSFLADNSAKKIRQYYLSHQKILIIDSFPERDNVQKRVFESVKMSVCVMLAKNELPNGAPFVLNTWRDKHKSTGSTAMFTPEELKTYDAVATPIPYLLEKEKAVFSKCFENINKNAISCFEGELNMTFHRSYFTQDQKNPKVIKGAQVQRYRLVDNLSQGVLEYVNDVAYLKDFANSKKSQHHKKNRIAMQGITGVDDKRRFVMSMVPSGLYCANSCNYILSNDEEYSEHFILALFNSYLFNWIFKKTSTNSNVNCYEVENMPIPKLNANNKKLAEMIANIAKSISNEVGEHTDIETEIDQLVYKLYDLTPEEIAIVEGS